MKTLPIVLAATALVAVAACSKKDDADTRSDASQHTVDIQADSETGDIAMKLPGGFDAKFKVPAGMTDEAKFDIDGVGLYPGAKVQKIKVNAVKKDGDRDATVELGFKAPADPAAVADWYQQQFEAKKISVSRSGETLTGKTEDGDDFSLALVAGGTGVTQGTLTIRDVKKG
jgi:hypothetical protein